MHSIFASLLVFPLALHAGFASVTPYPRPPFLESSKEYQVTADGKPIDVATYQDYHFARFAATGSLKVQVTAKDGANLDKATISPASFGLTLTKADREVSFTVEIGVRAQPDYLLLQIPGGEDLILFIDPLDSEPIPKLGPGVADVTAAPYHADATGKALATSAIQRAIDDVSTAGGGIVLVPPGMFNVTQITLRGKGVRLHLDPATVIAGSIHPSDYPPGPSDRSLRPTEALVLVAGATDASITGRGILTPRGRELGVQDAHGRSREFRRHVISGVENQPSNGIRIEGVLCLDGTAWSIRTSAIDNLVIRNVKVINDKHIHWSDGIDINNSKNALVDRCFVYVGDDAFCTKTRFPDLPVENAVHRNSIVCSSAAGLRVGPETQANISGVVFENIDVLRAQRALIVDTGKGGHSIQNITFRDIRVETIASRPPNFIGRGIYVRRPIFIRAAEGPIRNVRFEQVQLSGPTEERSAILGAKGGVQGVIFDRVTLAGVKVTDKETLHLTMEGSVEKVMFELP